MDTRQLKRRLVIGFLALMLLAFLVVILAKGTVASAPIYAPGDANGDLVVDMGDVTYIELVILYNWPVLGDGDANRDGAVNVGDITKVERLILGLDK